MTPPIPCDGANITMLNIHGFTIVEVLVALLVLSVGLLSTLSVFGSVARTFSDSRATIMAFAEAAEVLEKVRGGACSRFVAGGGAANLTWIIDEVAPTLRRATVIVHSSGVRARRDTFSVTVPC